MRKAIVIETKSNDVNLHMFDIGEEVTFIGWYSGKSPKSGTFRNEEGLEQLLRPSQFRWVDEMDEELNDYARYEEDAR